MGDILQNKIQDADFLDRDITSIEGNVVAGQADWLKQRFDSSVKQVVAPRLNALIDDLAATTAAGQLGTSPLLPGGAATVGGQLAYLKDELNGVALSQIPDGAVTDEKLSGAPGQVKARLGAVEQDKAPLISPAFAGEPTAPTAAEGDNSEKLANTAYVQGEITPANAHIADGDLHVTAALNQKLAGFEPLKLLWSGTWESGSISVPDFQNYRYLCFDGWAAGSPMFVVNYGTYGRGAGGSVKSTGAPETSHVNFNVSDTTLTLTECKRVGHQDGTTHTTVYAEKIKNIYGIA